jgi:universal stress protein A
MTTFTRVLVPIDFSPCSEAALAHATEIARRFGAVIDVLHAWEPPRLSAPESSLGIVNPDAHSILVEFEHTRHGASMKSILALLEECGIDDVRGRLEPGEPSETILRVAREGYYDLIVMGTHGRTGLAHLFLGSVAERVVRRAPCPVLTIRVSELAQASAIPTTAWARQQHAPS